jgi:hypothetical protein
MRVLFVGSLIAAFAWLDVLMVLFTVTGVCFPTQGVSSQT